jgi:hypothetical protein
MKFTPPGFAIRCKACLATLLAGLVFCSAAPAQSTTNAATESKPKPPRSLVEIYRIAPGKHEEFLRFVAMLDEINIKAGLPPRQLYVHQDGADWDFVLIQPASTPPEFAAAFEQAWAESGAPSGANFFLKIREFIAEHSDTFATGPTNAADYLSGVDSED